MALLEVCIDNAAGLETCAAANVARIELCSGLTLGGLTPSIGLIQLAQHIPARVRVLIRPRPGNFCFNDNEVSLMCDDIEAAANIGVEGVVLGAADHRNNLDIITLDRLCRVAGALKKTLHRVVDTLDNPLDAVEQAIDLGFDCILSSGGMPCVKNGADLLTKMHRQADGRIDIMAGAGLRPSMIEALYQQTGISTFHSSCTRPSLEKQSLVSLGFATVESRLTDLAVIDAYKRALSSIA